MKGLGIKGHAGFQIVFMMLEVFKEVLNSGFTLSQAVKQRTLNSLLVPQFPQALNEI